MSGIVLGRAVVALIVFFNVAPQAGDTLEVAAIHHSRADSVNTRIDFQPGGRLVILNATLRTLLRNAYGLQPFQLVDEPKWSDSEGFDIEAKNASGQQITQEALKPLLQGLLADRFQLKARWVTREEPIYAVVVEKGGPKFRAHADGPETGMNTGRGPGKATLRGTGVPMTELASNIGFRLQRFVVDDTGLPGHYDFFLHWNPDPEDSTEPSLATALHEQLGLKLEPRRGPVQMLVIDRVEKPTEN